MHCPDWESEAYLVFGAVSPGLIKIQLFIILQLLEEIVALFRQRCVAGRVDDYAAWSNNAPLMPFLRMQVGIADTVERKPTDRPACWLGNPTPEAAALLCSYFGAADVTELNHCCPMYRPKMSRQCLTRWEKYTDASQLHFS